MIDIARIALLFLNIGLSVLCIKRLFKNVAESGWDWVLAIYFVIIIAFGASAISFLLPAAIWGMLA